MIDLGAKQLRARKKRGSRKEREIRFLTLPQFRPTTPASLPRLGIHTYTHTHNASSSLSHTHTHAYITNLLLVQHHHSAPSSDSDVGRLANRRAHAHTQTSAEQKILTKDDPRSWKKKKKMGKSGLGREPKVGTFSDPTRPQTSTKWSTTLPAHFNTISGTENLLFHR